MIKPITLLTASLLSTSLLIGCGDGGGGGGSTAATITSANAKDLAIASAESTKQAVATDSANFLSKPSNNTNSSDLITNKVLEIVHQAQTLGLICTGGGNYNDNISQNSSSPSGTITFTNCNVGGDITINGSITFSVNQNTTTLTYNNLTVSGLGQTTTINANIICTNSNQTYSCNTSTSITGIDGRTYAVSNVSVSGNEFSGYTVSASVTDPTHGTLTINATAVKFDCSSPNAGRPSSGSITFSSNGNSGSVIFNSCSSYTVTVDGLANIYTW